MADSTIEEEGKQVEDVTTTGYRTGTSGTFKSTTSDSIITELLPSSDLVEKSSSDSVEKSEKKSSSDLVEEKSVVEAAGSEDIVFNSKKKSIIQHPLTLSWSFGYNSKLPVHNVSEGNRKMIFYSSAHTGVLLDCKTNQQSLLQGHSNAITSTTVSLDRRWLVTGDVGPDCMITVWDSFSGIPVRNIFSHMADGVVAIAMSSDAKYIAVITTGNKQVVSVWEWTVEGEDPLCYIALSEDYSYQTFITFHPNDPHQLISNSADLVVFYYWDKNDIKADSHPILDKEFHKPLGSFSESVLVPETSLGLTGTSEGNGVVWATVDGSAEGPHIKKAMKLLKMHSCAITVVTYVMDMVVTGDANGKIQFFNNVLMLVNWYDDCSRFGPLTSVSFSYDPKLPKLKQMMRKENLSDDSLGEHQFPDESTKPALPFLIPDFVISTSNSSIAHVTTNGSLVQNLLNEHDAAVNALSAHPSLPRLLVGSYSGRLKLWDYEKKVVLSKRDILEPTFLHCVNFDPKGELIGIGYTNGILQLVDSLTLSDVGNQFHYSRDAITHIAFSHDSKYLATADLDLCVAVYESQPSDPESPWEFLAKHRSHYMTIMDLMFGVKLDTNTPSLFSLGKDRTLVEYDLQNSIKDDLVLFSIERIEQSAIPLAMTWYPPLVKESFIITANDQYKLKLYNSTTKMCRKTLLGPVYGSPLRKICILPTSQDGGSKNKLQDRRYLVYCTTSKVGIVLLPHDGNPHNSKCLVAHPGKVNTLTCAYDGKYVFSAGGEDLTVNMWTVNTDALEAASLLGGEDLEPFYAMIDGGRSGEQFSELEEFFYYAQIRSQGPDVTCRREISTTISIESIPSVMRAIGFYPSEQEVEDMINEVKFSKFVGTKQCVKFIDLGDFIRLYVNHRPVFGLSPHQIGAAFKVLGDKEEGENHWEVYRSELLTLLQERGEHLTEADMVEYLVTLLGYSDNPEVEGSFTDDAIVALKQIPEKISAPAFAEDIVGLTTDQPKHPQQEEEEQLDQQDQQQPHQQLVA